MSKVREYRFLNKTGELRATSGRTIVGYVVKYGDWSQVLGDRNEQFVEQVVQGAFDESLMGGDDIRCLVEHDPKLLLGRNTSGTLVMSSDNIGLKFSVSVPKTTLGDDTLEMVSRGDIVGASVGMIVHQDSWKNGKPARRTITQASVFDCSLTATPAYPTTTAAVRSLFPDGMPKRVTTVEPTFGGIPVSQLSDDDFRLYTRLRIAQSEL
jgi:HK97 family phage prohead protease